MSLCSLYTYIYTCIYIYVYVCRFLYSLCCRSSDPLTYADGYQDAVAGSIRSAGLRRVLQRCLSTKRRRVCCFLSMFCDSKSTTSTNKSTPPCILDVTATRLPTVRTMGKARQTPNHQSSGSGPPPQTYYSY